MSKTNASKAAPLPTEFNVSEHAVICDTAGVTMLKDSYLKVILQLPLPGIVIFVHGVNSDGEWYDQAEEGLCQGLNDRLKRNDDQMAHPTAQGGQLTPAKYLGELTPDGFINADRQPDSFIEEGSHFSPVIRFRWGYKASSEELQAYGDGIYLNEQNYWGGGPFANGCTSLPDLWSEGISQAMFLYWNIGHFNPIDERPVFACPPRPYFVLAALRLAKLIESIRKLQANVPVTIVCHSQGNMVAIAAAFLGDRLPEVVSADGISGRCVADSYVLCNPPYSLQTAKFIENWSERHMKDRDGGSGRQTAQARMQTMANFFDIIRKPSSAFLQEADDINRMMENKRYQFEAAKDREEFGYGMPKRTCGRVTLYCNPHDQVISATTIRGIGWLGMSADEIDKTNGRGVFCQRVFAQDFEVSGACKQYEYWGNNHRKVKEGSNDFWMPPSPTVSYSFTSDASKEFIGTIVTFAAAPLMILLTKVAGMPVNAVPPEKWAIPLDAPNLPKSFKPMGLRNAPFDEGRSSPGEERDASRIREKDDPYAGANKIKQYKGEPARPLTDAGRGDVKSEAQLRYEHHGRLRMEARRAGFAKKEDEHVTAEDEPGMASKEYKDWHSKRIKGYLGNNVDSNAADHSTIMTNPVHSKMALAYDVAVGFCNIPFSEIRTLRVFADWRFAKAVKKENPIFWIANYFTNGKVKFISPSKWAISDCEAKMPANITDRREQSPSQHNKETRHDY